MGLITLEISSIFIQDISSVVDILLSSKVQCKVIPTINIINSDSPPEKGCDIQIYNIKEKDFVKVVWRPLQERFKLNCALIRTETYVGCIKNWPRICRKSKCPGQSKK